MSSTLITTLGFASYVLTRKKVLDKLSGALSWFLEPVQIKRIEAAKDEAKMNSLINEENMLDYKAMCAQFRERNVTKALAKAIQACPDDEVADEQLDPDWFFMWMENAGNFSREEINDLWAKLLERELKSPESISLRTMDTLRTMSKAEAQAFSKICKYCMEFGDTRFIYSDSHAGRTYPFNWDDMIKAEEAGLIQIKEGLMQEIRADYENNDPEDVCVFDILYQNKKIHGEMRQPTTFLQFPIVLFTTAGTELYPIANNIKKADEDYLKYFLNFLTLQKIEYTVSDII